MTHTTFSAVVNGFQFVNRFTAPFPVKYNLPILGEVDLSKVVFGLCGGMCFAALDYYYAGQMAPPYTKVEDIDLRLYTYLCERQLDSLNIPVVMKVIEWMLREDREIAARMSRSELPKLRKALDQGKPAVLALIRVGGAGDPTQNHQVLAIGYDLDLASGTLSIQIYDPNHPHKETSLSLNVSDPRNGIQIKQGTGEPLRGFFIIPHKPQKKLPQLFPERPRVEFGRDSLALPIRLRWPVDSGRVNQYFGENPKTYKPFGLPGHEGLDLFARSGANVYAAAEGEVYEAGFPKGHPYGRQIRIRHEIQNRVYSTVYAHLSEVFVQPGQRVAAGETIGLADNTGNSFGSHLHLTLKIEGERTRGYPDGIVDPWPYFQETAVVSPAAVQTFQGWTVYSISEASLMTGSEPEAQVAAVLPSGEFLGVLGDVEAARSKIGLQGEWLQVLSAGGQSGFIGAWLVQNAEGAFPPSDLVVFPNDVVNLRSGPGTVFNLLGTLKVGQPLTVLGDADRARSRLGREKEWLQIQTEDGLRGFVAAWLIHQTGQFPPPSGLVVFPVQALNVRARPSTESNILTVVSPGDALTVLGEKDQAEGSIGQMDRWLNVRTPGKFVGYVAAWLVSTSSGPPPSSQAASGLTVYPTADINLRAQPSVNSPRVNGAFRAEPLLVIEPDQAEAQDKIGKEALWIYVQKKDGNRGWAAAWLLSMMPV